jgi:hypothetical protein
MKGEIIRYHQTWRIILSGIIRVKITILLLHIYSRYIEDLCIMHFNPFIQIESGPYGDFLPFLKIFGARKSIEGEIIFAIQMGQLTL